MEKNNRKKVRLAATVLALLSLGIVPAMGLPHGPAAKKEKKKEKMVYVCACMGTGSCQCMTESKAEGPCACGPNGGPPMKAVPVDSGWAKSNREQLAKQ